MYKLYITTRESLTQSSTPYNSARPTDTASSSPALSPDLMALVQMMVPRALQLRGVYQECVARGDEDTAKGCGSIYIYVYIHTYVCVRIQIHYTHTH